MELFAQNFDKAELLEKKVPASISLIDLLNELKEEYSERGIHLEQINNSWAFRTSPVVSENLIIERVVRKSLSRPALETLSIIAYHQPVTRAEIENIRGVSISKGTLDNLLELEWIRPGRRKSTPGNPLTWITTNSFLDYFNLKNINDLPGIEDLKNSGLLDKNKIIFNI